MSSHAVDVSELGRSASARKDAVLMVMCRLQAAPAQELPFRSDCARYEHLVNNIDRLYCCVNTPN
jgi:hypothetical protein